MVECRLSVKALVVLLGWPLSVLRLGLSASDQLPKGGGGGI